MPRAKSGPAPETLMCARIAKRLNERGWSMERISQPWGVAASTVNQWFTAIGYRSILPRGGRPGPRKRIGNYEPKHFNAKPVPFACEKRIMANVRYEDVPLPRSQSKIIRVLRPLSPPAAVGSCGALCVDAAMAE